MTQTFRVTGPDGTVYRVTAPAGATEAEVLDRVRRQAQHDAAPKEYHGWSEYLADGARAAVGQGFALGFGDEIAAGARSFIGGEDYDKALKDEREAVARFRHHNPATSFVAEGVGALAMPGGLMARGAMTAGRTALGTMAQGAKYGAGYGALAGFGAGEDGLANRAQSAATGAAVGGAVGAAIPGVVAGTRAAAKPIVDMVRPHRVNRTQGPDEAANYILGRRMEAAGTSPAAVRGDLAAGQRSARMNSNSRANLPEMLADTSDDMQRLTGTVYRQGGEAGNIVRGAIEGRQRGPANPFSPQPGEPPGQLSDITDAINRALTVSSKGSARQNTRQIMAAQKAEADRLYQQAEMNAEPFDLSPAIQAFHLKAANYSGQFRAVLNRAMRLFTRNDYGSDSIRRFDAAKKQLDDMIEASFTQTNMGPQATNLTRELTQFKEMLLREVHAPNAAGQPTRNLPYAEARSAWGSAAERRAAIETGQRALRENSDVTAEAFRAMSSGEQAMFRIGFMDAVRNALGTRRPGNDATMLFQQRRVQELLREIVPASRKRSDVFHDRPQRVGDYLNRQQRMSDTRNRVLGGSPTQQRQMDDMKGAGDMLAGALEMLRGNANWALEAAVGALNRVGGMNAEVSAALARKLTTTNRQEQNAILRRIRAQMGEPRFRVFTEELSRRLAVGSAAAGNLSGQATAE